jgi:hypothetical protein
VIIQDFQDLSRTVLAVGRLSVGLIGESRRSAHLFDLDVDSKRLTSLTSRCGNELPVSDIEWLSLGAGMPCERCLGLGSTDPQVLPRRHRVVTESSPSRQKQ